MRKPSITIECILARGRETATPRLCDAAGCDCEGLYPAPKSPNNLRQYLWFCLDHVRAYNRAWNYFANMDTAGINNYIDAATTWERPSWPFGVRGRTPMTEERIHDPFETRRDWQRHNTTSNNKNSRHSNHPFLPTEVKSALATLGISVRCDWRNRWQEIRNQYKALAKKHHPDTQAGMHANGDTTTGDEEKLKHITHAFAVLQKHKNAD